MILLYTSIYQGIHLPIKENLKAYLEVKMLKIDWQKLENELRKLYSASDVLFNHSLSGYRS